MARSSRRLEDLSAQLLLLFAATNLRSLPADSSPPNGLTAGRYVCVVFLNAHARSRGMNSEPVAASAEPIESRGIVPDRDDRTLKTHVQRGGSSANVPCRHSAWLRRFVLPPRGSGARPNSLPVRGRELETRCRGAEAPLDYLNDVDRNFVLETIRPYAHIARLGMTWSCLASAPAMERTSLP